MESAREAVSVRVVGEDMGRWGRGDVEDEEWRKEEQEEESGGSRELEGKVVHG